MVYQIYFLSKDEKQSGRGTTMFDIEYYMKKNEIDGSTWYSEVHCLPCVDGLTHFLKEQRANDEFDYDEFIKNGMEIQEIRGLLYETYDNKPKVYKEANYFHYHVFGEILEKKIHAFADKYGLFINVD